ncbi:hypothetical protein GCM10009798_05860 [Nocardioides panacihumi]|uniref:Aminoglycoside phosphotransferase domain-containing protein n=1 Tax=Nocardioides panacihumi TaxID=400774 RepID=A0ABN2QCA0_9ACTN
MDLLTSLTPLDGGWSGETFLAEVAGERSVVRIFAGPRHAEHAAEIQEVLLRLVRGLVPVPAVKEVRRADADAEAPGLLVTELLDGVRGDVLLPALDAQGQGVVGGRLGTIAATLAGMPHVAAGMFVDATLRVRPFAPDLEEWVAQHEDLLDWSDADLAGLRAVAAHAQDRLDEVGRVSLVHGDLNLKNVLVDADTLEITGVVDWEFAHAGSPYADLGNLLRFDREPAYADAVLRGWTQLRGDDPATARERARSADLVALVDLAARKDANPVAARAHDRLLVIARSRDLHATDQSRLLTSE